MEKEVSWSLVTESLILSLVLQKGVYRELNLIVL